MGSVGRAPVSYTHLDVYKRQAQDELGLACQDFDQMRRRLQESVQAQQAYEQGRKELIAGISHDLSTPLTSLKGYVLSLIHI